MISRRGLAIGDATRIFAVGAAIFVCAWLAIRLGRPAGGIAIIWVASGLLTGILLTSPNRRWTSYILAGLAGTLLARVACGDPLSIVIIRGVASTIEVSTVVYTLRYFLGDTGDPAKVARVSALSLVSTVCACALSALIVAAQAALAGGAFGSVFIEWFIAHTLGMIIVATLVVVARRQGMALFGRPGRRWQFAGSLAIVAATTVAVFSQSEYPLLFLIYLPLMFAVFRHHFSGVAVGIAVIMLIAVTATVMGRGPMFLVHGVSIREHVLLLQAFLAAACLLSLPVAIVLAERGRLNARMRASERNYRVLADHTRDIVVRLRADERHLYVSPSVKQVLGWTRKDFAVPRWDLVHPDDRERLMDATQKLFETGVQTTLIYRLRHKDGHYVWIEALAGRVDDGEPGALAEIIYSGRDISKRVAARTSLAESEATLRTITDNLPAMVMRLDDEQRYTFVNAHIGKLFGIDPATMIGRKIGETVDENLYAGIRPHIEAALRGERVTFEGEIEANGQRFYRQANYLPDLRADGTVKGLYSLTYDITELHDAKEELARIAQHDALTGLGNRNKFNDRLSQALARSRRSGRPIALVCLDVDHFKQINDSFGHAAGDAILCKFAQRLQQNVRDSDVAVRLGGDEFAVIIEDFDALDVPEIVAAKLVAAMQPPFSALGSEFRVTTSIGVGVSRSAPAAEALMQCADGALYAAKAAGRNTYRVALFD